MKEINDLKEIATSINELNGDKFKAIEAFLKKTVEDIDKKCKNNIDQKFVFTAKGTYEETMAFGKIKNQTRTTPFDIIFVGRITKDGIQDFLLQGDLQTFSLMLVSKVLMMCRDLYKWESGGRSVFKKQKDNKLYLHYRGRLEPNWELLDLVRSLLDESTIRTLWPSTQFKVNTSLIIGDSDFDEFFKKHPNKGILIPALEEIKFA